MSAAVQPSLLPSNNSTMKGTACSAASGGANSNCSMLHEHFRFVVYLWKIHVTPSPPHIPVSAKLVLLSMWSLSGNHLLIFRILPMQGTPHLEGIWKSFCSCLALGYLEKDNNGHLFIHPGTPLSYYRRQSLYRYYFLELNWFCVNVWGFFSFLLLLKRLLQFQALAVCSHSDFWSFKKCPWERETDQLWEAKCIHTKFYSLLFSRAKILTHDSSCSSPKAGTEEHGWWTMVRTGWRLD